MVAVLKIPSMAKFKNSGRPNRLTPVEKPKNRIE
jgi:hypothetical protein